MNKRDIMLSLIHDSAPASYTPAAFFLHFDPAYHHGQAAIDKHLAFFQFTGMDFVKIQYEQIQPARPPFRSPADWADAPRYGKAFFEDPIAIARGLVQAVNREALVIMTIYSPFMWAGHLAGADTLNQHLRDDPAAVSKGLEIMTENVLELVRGCKQAGVDGFYVSTQGGEAFRFPGTDIFQRYVKPTDLAVWEAVRDCSFNILHVCDYVSGYADLSPFLDYPGHVVNASLTVGDQGMQPKQLSKLFGRPFMGGLERKGTIATGSIDAIREEVSAILSEAPEHFILGADCTVPSETDWEHLRIAIDTAHHHLG